MLSSMRLNSTASTLILAVLIAGGVTAGIYYLQKLESGDNPVSMQSLVTNLSASSAAKTTTGSVATANNSQAWAASAPGRVEPKGGNVRVRAEASGVITRVLVVTGDKVRKGDILALLKDDDTVAKLAAARAEVAVRLGERDEEPEKNTLMIDRRRADDAVAAAERRLHDAQIAFDQKAIDGQSNGKPAPELAAERKEIVDARNAIEEARDRRSEVLKKMGMPKPTRLDSGLALARSDLRLAELAYERTRVRSTANGTILSLNAVAGETLGPSSPAPLAVIGDLSAVQVMAEVDERDVSKVRKGQSVIVRSNAFPGRDFKGKVTAIDPALGSPSIKARGPRNPSDVDVLEVEVAIEGDPVLMPGMRVDVFFKGEQNVKAAANN